MTILTSSARLANKSTFGLHRFGDGFPVGHLGFSHVGLDIELPQESIDNDFQMEFPHAGEYGLPRFFICSYLEGRIFQNQFLEGSSKSFKVALCLRFNCDRNHRVREGHRLENDWLFLTA